MIRIPKQIIDNFVAVCREAGARGLARCSSGNLSSRLDEDRMLVTASRSWMATLTHEDITVCRICDETVLQGNRPSVETRFHAGIFRGRPGVGAVLHFQSPAATTVACTTPRDIDYNVIPEIPFYIGPVARIPFIQPGSADLAAAVVEAAQTHNLVVLSNHGIVAVADDLDHVLQNAQFFELACEIILRGGNSICPIPPEGARLLREQGGGA